ncbi:MULTISPECIES: hypothetical protein [Agrobacterium]|jgi:hypothetical protein|uniref:Uncharacterized protein n=2 Tax=Agrobacterium tumefaciens complex TaxID=1183400 RepID=A0AAW8M219_AGRTU|nr:MULTISPECIES: hypothetical protein [Agrobacterium]MCP2138181.1 hypothetical protein [Rhizobium sp. SLBN-94]KAB0459005.1 hypothetical protein F7R04_14270 [Agrobacterium tumefaciens]KWT79248.1 hypothetical protein ASH09_22240 [Agrobacterium radiobacter]MBB4321420.1 hypothetical protein [Agrobacterium radiobacter]MBB4338514.1 hypothetical protein [Agrobacterium radiobacter]
MADFKQFAASSNGDNWYLGTRDDATSVVRHKGNPASGGHETEMRIEEFLLLRPFSPEQAALIEFLDAGVDQQDQSSLDSSSL